MSTAAEFLTIAGIHFLAVVSPGPDFAVVSRNSLSHSRRMGVWSAAGVALGIVVHIAYCLAGVGWIVARSPLLFALLRGAGAGYLLFIGARAFFARPGGPRSVDRGSAPALTAFGALRMGFLTNVLNPKATLFFLGLFTQVIRPATPFLVEMIYAAEMVTITFAWFAFLALALSHRSVVGALGKAQPHVERAMGLALAGFGGWMAFSSVLG